MGEGLRIGERSSRKLRQLEKSQIGERDSRKARQMGEDKISVIFLASFAESSN